MRVVVITPPDPVVTWEKAKAHLNLDDDGERTFVEGLVAAATGHIDGPMGWLGRSLGQQELEARFDLFPLAGEIRLPLGPVIGLVSVKYLDLEGVEQTVDIADFATYDDVLIPEAAFFPWGRNGGYKREAGRVRYHAGFANIPPEITAAILLMVGDLYRFRTTASDMSMTPNAVPMSVTVERLLNPWRLYG